MPGNRPDGDPMVATVVEQKAHGLVPAKLIGDTAYSDGTSRKELKEHGTEVVAPLRTANPRTKAVYPKGLFAYDRAQNTLTCPAGVTVGQAFYDQGHHLRVFHFPMTACGTCPRKPACTSAKDGRRTVGISEGNEALREAEAYNRTEQFKAEMKLRPLSRGSSRS